MLHIFGLYKHKVILKMGTIQQNSGRLTQKRYTEVSDLLFNTLFENLQEQSTGEKGVAHFTASIGKNTLDFYTHDYDLDSMVTVNSGRDTKNGWLNFSFNESQLERMKDKLDKAFQNEPLQEAIEDYDPREHGLYGFGY